MRKRMIALASIVIVLLAIMYLPDASAQTTGADYDLSPTQTFGAVAGHFYTQANGGAGPNFGYRITDEAGVKFWSEFQRLGGVPVLGYPSSRRFTMDGFTVQATQKYILQWRPEVGQAYFVNVFDKLHDLGQDAALQARFNIPPQADPNIDQATRLGWLNADPAVAAQFGTGPGALQTNGLPTSQITPAGAFSIIRAERDAIQHWNQAGPGGIQPGAVTVVNGGDVAKSLGLVPSDAQITETASGQLAATPTPVATATPAFAWRAKNPTDPPVRCGLVAYGDPNYEPCELSDPNAGTQRVYGHILDPNGNGISGIIIQATAYGNN
ncbi:MAG TPA: hypothetical protein VFS62_06465, partial [Chloroflexota bacterium]|nr:hypothetical protein [Chloroflexota bacterium]